MPLIFDRSPQARSTRPCARKVASNRHATWGPRDNIQGVAEMALPRALPAGLQRWEVVLRGRSSSLRKVHSQDPSPWAPSAVTTAYCRAIGESSECGVHAFVPPPASASASPSAQRGQFAIRGLSVFVNGSRLTGRNKPLPHSSTRRTPLLGTLPVARDACDCEGPR